MGFFRTLFGPTRTELWKELAERTGSEFDKGGFWKKPRHTSRYRNWTITLEEDLHHSSQGNNTNYQVVTRIRSPFLSTNGFRFQITRKSIFSGIPKLFGFQPLLTGDEKFDAVMKISSNNPPQLLALLESDSLRELLLEIPRMNLTIQDDLGFLGGKVPQAVDFLIYRVSSRIRSIDQLLLLLTLFGKLLDELCEIGEASPENPLFSL